MLEPRPSEPVRVALDAILDTSSAEWDALRADAVDEDTRETLDALRRIASIAMAHGRMLQPERALPFCWGPLVVREHLARGAHGDVYRAWDPRLERDVALKLLRRDLPDAAAPAAVAEGRMLARVRHPNVVVIHGADRIDGEAGIWMELVVGRTLHARVTDEGPLSAADVVATGRDVCDALSAIHAAGLVHRDVKAQNVMQDRAGRTIVMDLGASEDLGGLCARLEGTPAYLAPELLGPYPDATVATDLYALGVLLFFLATGRHPITSTSLEDLRAAHRAGPVAAAATRAGLPIGLAKVIDRAMSASAGDRYRTPADMREALAQAEVRRRPRTSAASLLAIAALTAAVVAGVTTLASSRKVGPSLEQLADDGRPLPLPPHAVGAPSADGRFLSYLDARGNVYRWDVVAARSQFVVRADEAAGAAVAAVLSHDAEQVAYSWRLPDRWHELRTVQADGSWPRVLLPAQRAYEPVPLDWSRDGRHVLVSLRRDDAASELVMIDTVDAGRNDEPRRVLLTTPAGTLVSGTLDADGRHAYVATIAGTGADALLQVDTRTLTSRVLVHGPFRAPQVLADGRLFFLRNDSRETFGWALPMRGDQPAGPPALVTASLGGAVHARATDHDLLVRVTRNVAADVYTVSFDAAHGVTGTPARVDPQALGNHVAPAWAPDGRRLAYFSIRQASAGTAPERTLMVRDMRSGVSRTVPVSLSFLAGYTPSWSPDGRAVTVWGRDRSDGDSWGYFRVDIESGTTTLVVRLGIDAPAHAQYAPGGDSFLYTDPRRGIVSRSVISGMERVLVAVDGMSLPTRFTLAPDGETLAFTRVTGRHDAPATAIVVRSPDGRTTVRDRAVWPSWTTVQAWAPDGEHLLVVRGTPQGSASLWRLSTADAAAVDLGFAAPQGPNGIVLSPDGRRLAYADRVQSPELRVSRLQPR